MGNNNIVIYLKKFQMAILIFLLVIIAIVFMIKQTIPKIQKLNEIQNNCKTQTTVLADTERRLSDLKNTLEQEKAEDEQIIKAFFKPSNSNVDTETAVSEEFLEILQLLRDNKIKTRSLKFDPDPPEDNFVANAGYKYFVSKMSAQMIATYSDFEGFLRDLYKHEHFIDISKIQIVPYKKNKRILLIDLEIKLYAQKDESTASGYNTNNYVPAESSNSNNREKAQPSGREVQNKQQQNNNSDSSNEMSETHKIFEDNSDLNSM